MKAVLCRQWGPPESLTVEDVPEPVPGDGEVLVEVHAAGVNFPDALIIQKQYQVQPGLPFSPGVEVAGIVKAVGRGAGKEAQSAGYGWKPGDRVIANATWGGYAQAMIARAERVSPIPEGMDFITASAFVLAYGTSLFALQDRARLRGGETLLVLGAAGGVGIAAVEIGKALGARVIAAASSEEKLSFCREHGADDTINYSVQDLRERVRILTEGRGPDVIYDPVGGEYTEAAFRSIAWEGRHLIVGFAAGEVPRLPLNLPLLKTASIVGAFWGAFVRRDRQRTHEHMRDLAGLYLSGKVRPPVTRTYALAQASNALRDVLDRKVMGKIVIIPNG